MEPEIAGVADSYFGEGNWEHVGTTLVGNLPVHLFRLFNIEAEWGHLQPNTLGEPGQWFFDTHEPTEREREELGI